MSRTSSIGCLSAIQITGGGQNELKGNRQNLYGILNNAGRTSAPAEPVRPSVASRPKRVSKSESKTSQTGCQYLLNSGRDQLLTDCVYDIVGKNTVKNPTPEKEKVRIDEDKVRITYPSIQVKRSSSYVPPMGRSSSSSSLRMIYGAEYKPLTVEQDQNDVQEEIPRSLEKPEHRQKGSCFESITERISFDEPKPEPPSDPCNPPVNCESQPNLCCRRDLDICLGEHPCGDLAYDEKEEIDWKQLPMRLMATHWQCKPKLWEIKRTDLPVIEEALDIQTSPDQCWILNMRNKHDGTCPCKCPNAFSKLPKGNVDPFVTRLKTAALINNEYSK